MSRLQWPDSPNSLSDDPGTVQFAGVTNRLATDTRRAVACGPEMPRQKFRAEIAASSEPSTRLTPGAAFLEPAEEPVPDGLGDDVSSIATRRAAELSECLGRLRRGRQQIRRVTG